MDVHEAAPSSFVWKVESPTEELNKNAAPDELDGLGGVARIAV
jgi:hypothetical protein